MIKGTPTFGIEIETGDGWDTKVGPIVDRQKIPHVPYGTRNSSSVKTHWGAYHDGGVELTTPILKSATDAEKVARFVQVLADEGVSLGAHPHARGMHFYVGRDDSLETHTHLTELNPDYLDKFKALIRFYLKYQPVFYRFTVKYRAQINHMTSVDHFRFIDTPGSDFSPLRGYGRSTFGFHRLHSGALENRVTGVVLEHDYALSVLGLAKQIADHFLGDHVPVDKLPSKVEHMVADVPESITQFFVDAGFFEEYGTPADRDLRKFTIKQLQRNVARFI